MVSFFFSLYRKSLWKGCQCQCVFVLCSGFPLANPPGFCSCLSTCSWQLSNVSDVLSGHPVLCTNQAEPALDGLALCWAKGRLMSAGTCPLLTCCEAPASASAMSPRCSSNHGEWRQLTHVPAVLLWMTFLGACLFMFWKLLWTLASWVHMCYLGNQHSTGVFSSHCIASLLHHSWLLTLPSKPTAVPNPCLSLCFQENQKASCSSVSPHPLKV